MTVSLKHKFTSLKPEPSDPSLVKASNWNEEHDMIMASARMIGRITADVGPVEELDATQIKLLLGLDQVSNIPPANMPISAPVQAALDLKLDTKYFGIIPEMVGAPADGIGDDGPAWQTCFNSGRTLILTSANYRLLTIPKIPPGGTVRIIGIGKGNRRPRVTGAPEGTFFWTRDTSTINTNVFGIHLEGVWFDGENQRDPGNYPYRDYHGPRGPNSVFSLFADASNPDSWTKIVDCEFTDFASYPYQCYEFAGKNEGRNNIFSRCKDPGYVNCHNGEWIGNLMRYGADNGVSISRGCTNWTISDNIAHDCEFAGIYVSGYNIIGTGTCTVSGVYTVGGVVDIAFSTYQMLGSWKEKVITIEDAAGVQSMIKVTEVLSGTAGKGLVMTAIPASMQNIPAAIFYQAPSLGPVGVSMNNNVVLGSGLAALQMTSGPKAVTVTGETYLRNGWVADSEVATRGSIQATTTQLVLNDATHFVTPCYVLIKPYNTQQVYRIVRAATKAGNTLTLNAPFNTTYMDVEIRLLHVEANGGFTIWTDGNFIGAQEYAEDIHVSDITIRDYYSDMIRIGNTGKGPVRNMSFKDIRHRQVDSTQAQSGRRIITLYEGKSDNPVLPYTYPADGMIFERFITDDQAAFFEGYQHGLVQRKWEFKDIRNPGVGISTHIVAKNLDASNTVIPNLYHYSRTGQDGVSRSDVLKLEAAVAVTATAGVIDILASSVVYTPLAANVDITSFTSLTMPVAGAGLPVFFIRNPHGVNTFTLINGSLLRTHTGANVIVGPNDVAFCLFITATIVQVMSVAAP